MKSIRFTKQGFDDFELERKNLQETRIGAVKELTRAREMGDLSENAAYRVARSKLSRVDSRLRYLDRILKNAKVVQLSTDGFIDIGSMVVISDGKEEHKIQLVDGYESDIMKGKISVYSPIGKELRGKKKDDKIRVELPDGFHEYTIISA